MMTQKINMLRKIAIASGLIIYAGAALAQQQPQGAPQPRILVIEGERIMRDSKVGKDIKRQFEAYGKQAQAEVTSRENALKAEQQKMQQQAAILSASAKAQKQKEFNAKVQQLQQFANSRQALVQGGLYKAQLTVNKAMKSVTDAIMKAKGANMLADKSLFMVVATNLDVTNEAIQRLDQMLPSLKVELVPLPPEVLAAAQRQAQQQQQQQR